ncbi:MAG TPA: sugar ABC transporter permease [Devosiaceae bacterium]|jgi:ABC-type sugar transport system permease subunit|nr:sugar ABC transporter permease [Devosiaceae bacterium]
MDGLAAASEAAAGNTAARRRKRRAATPWGIYSYLVPTMLLLAVFSYFPFLSAFYHSLFEWDGVNASFVGFQNFQRMLQDEALAASLPNVLILTAMSIFFALTLPLIAAEFIFNLRSQRAQLFYRFAFTVPLVIPWIVVVLVWQFIYDPIDGPLNALLTGLGLSHLTRAWLADPNIAIYAIGMLGGGGQGVGFPFVAGLNLLIYLAGLNNISREVIDASRLDGANVWQRFWLVDLPLVTGQIRIVLIISIIVSIQSFQTIILLTRGGPGYSTMVPGMAMYQNAFEFGRMGYASAIGVVLFVVMLAITMLVLNRLKSPTEADPA